MAVVALVVAALINANRWWLSACFTTTLIALVLATILAQRPFWRGYSIAGWTYFALTLTPLATVCEAWLPTTSAIMWVCDNGHSLGMLPPMSLLLEDPDMRTNWDQWYSSQQSHLAMMLLVRQLQLQCIAVFAVGIAGGAIATRLLRPKTVEGRRLGPTQF
jgi:hypothetical protein